MHLAKAFSGAHPSTQGTIPSWESEEGVHTPSGSKTPIVMCGWLYKMKREHRKFRSTWNRRWFTVEDGAFRWYKTPSSEQGGRMFLVNIAHVRKFEGGGHGNFTFIVQGTDRDMLLRADSANDVRRWTRGLTLQIDLVRGGTFQGPPSAKNRRRTVVRSTGENDAGVRGRVGATGGLESGCGRGTPLGPMQLEHRHFQQINDRIRALMDGHLESNSRRGQAFVAGREGNPPPDLDFHNTSPRHEGRDSGADDGAGTPTSVSVVQTFQPTPRGGHVGDGAGDSSPEQSPREDGDNGKVLRRWQPAKVVPFSSPPPSDAEEEEGDRSDSAWRRHGESPGGETKDGGRVPIVDRVSKPPPPKVPPPRNGGVRRGGSGVPSLRSTDSGQTVGDKGEDNSGSMGSGEKRGVLSRTYDEASSTEGSFDGHGGVEDQHRGRGGSAGSVEGRVACGRMISEGIDRRKSSSRGYDSTSGNGRSRGSPHFEDFEHGRRDAFIHVGQRGRRELHAGSESRDERASVHRLKKSMGRRCRDKQRGGIEDPVDFSSDESTHRREGIFMDEYFAGDNTRSSTSSAGVIAEKDAPIDRKSGGRSVDKLRDTRSPHPTKNAEGGRSTPSEADSATVSRHRHSPQGNRWRTSRSTTVGIKSVARRSASGDDASSDECDDSRERFHQGLADRTSGGSNAGGGTNGGNRWTASGMNSSLDKAFLRWSAGTGVSNRGMASCGYPRVSSSGSITAEESWSSGLGRGVEDDTSSRVGSGRLPSSRQSSSRQSSSARPARRYLMEQNRLRQGW